MANVVVAMYRSADTTSNDCERRFLCVEHSPEGNLVPPLEGCRESLEQEHGLSRLLCDSSDSSADLLD